MSIDKPSGNEKGSDFILTVVNPQSITYTNIGFDIRVYGKEAGDRMPIRALSLSPESLRTCSGPDNTVPFCRTGHVA